MALKWDNAAMDALARSTGVAGVVMQATERIASIARSTAPADSGDYKRGIRTALKYQRRAVGLVQATDEKSLIIESKKGTIARATKAAARSR